MDNAQHKKYILNSNPKSKFIAFEIILLTEYNDYNGGVFLDETTHILDLMNKDDFYQEPFYRLYGVYKDPIPKSRYFISDFPDLNSALELVYALNGTDL